ncbi:copper chaperone PCu(A)C [Halomonas sp. HAL1]|uniref:copper chaperone PCu(A)C n=1 Tax=Halomonas sp. HAL1 TaxID=550984 RepID=UPI00022D289D|nr:copper chaperone PCu(A)C [Halomonas sp. HAL1]EHA17056.1 copper metallochaperone [Halomonas sp. HAL1]WKV92956.1 copper chaperone PCu(A)C [Halomonas sp. HAL1]
MFKPIAWLGVCLVSTLSMVASVAIAHDVQTDTMRIAHPFAIPTPPGAANGAAYLDITAFSDPVALIGASSPASKTVELHDMRMDGDMMRMRHVGELLIEAGKTYTMRPGGGFHLMLIGLSEPLTEGDRFPITLTFAEQGDVDIEVWVQSAQEGSEAADGHHHH